MNDLVLVMVGALASIAPITITLAGLYGLHERMDSLAHYTSGVSIGAASYVLVAEPLVAIAVSVALALFWEWLEPKFAWVKNHGSQDTEADISLVVLGTSHLMLAVLLV